MNSGFRVLYAEDNALDADLTRVYFSEHAPDFEIEIAETGEACIDRLFKVEYDLLLLDHCLPDMEGMDVLRTLVHNCVSVPVVLITGSGDEDLVVKALHLGAANYVPKLGNYLETLPGLLRLIIKEHSLKISQGLLVAGPRRILYVEHHAMDIDLTVRHFAEAAPQVELDVIRTCAEALARLERSPMYDAVLIDLRMPDQSGLDFVREAKRRGLTLPPFVMISGKGDEGAAIASLTLGAADYVAKREGYLDQLPYAIDRAIAHDRLNRVNAQLQAELAERKRAQAELEEKRLFLNTLLDAIPVPVFYKGTDGRYLGFNRAFEKYFGRTHEELVGKSAFDIAPRELAEIYHAKDEELFRAPGVQVYETDMMNSQGQLRNVIYHKATYVDSNGRIAGLVGAILDITDRERAEEELQFRNAILSTQQETAIDGILVADGKGAIVSSNRRFADMWGIPPEIIESKSDERAMQSVMDNLANPEGFIGKVKYLYANPDEKSKDQIELKDGRTFDRYSAPMLGADGRNFGRVWYFRDITAQKRAAAERENLEEQLRASQKMEAIGSLAGGIAHDFNNLLSVILSYTGFAIDELPENDLIRNDLREVEKAGERAAALIRQLLAFGRKQVLQPVPLSLNQITAGLEKMLRRILGENIDFRQILAPDLGLTMADPGQIEQVLMNLVINARDAMAEGGELTVETSNVEVDEEYAARHVAVTPGSYVQLAVTDTGCGMDDKTRARIFEPFFTAKEKGKGTGLGLSTVYGIIKQSGGNIWVYSEPGKGTTFKIYLPRELSATEAMPIKPQTAAPSATGTETILVVEDEEALRKVAIRALQGAGYSVLAAANGEEALLISARHAGDIRLLLTDVIMPRMSGSVLAQEVTKTRPTLKVIYMSGYTDDAIVHHGALDAGTHFLAKPFTSVELTRKVREVLDIGSPATASP
jgi:two-component system cell cycle sensor histidine kinase/response regulator CckA